MLCCWQLKFPNSTPRTGYMTQSVEFTPMQLQRTAQFQDILPFLRWCTCQIRHPHGRHVPVTDNSLTVQNFQTNVSNFFPTCSTQDFRSATSNAPDFLLITGCSSKVTKAYLEATSVCLSVLRSPNCGPA